MDGLQQIRTLPLTETWIRVTLVSVSAEFIQNEHLDVVADIEVTYPFPARGIVRIHPDDYKLIEDGKSIMVIKENVKWMLPTVEW